MITLKKILKDKSYNLLVETNIDNLDYPFIAKNCFTNDYTIVTRIQQINCELIGYSIKNPIQQN